MKGLKKVLILIFSFFYFIFPSLYGLSNYKYLGIVILILLIIILGINKFKINFKINEKYYLIILILLVVLTRIGVAIIFNNKIMQVSDFGSALKAAKTGIFQGEYYQVFTHWIIYPKILNQIFKIFGAHQLVALLVNAIILSLNAILVYKNANLIFEKTNYGFYSALLYILWPSNILYTVIVTPEHFCTFFLMLILYLFMILIKHNFYINDKIKFVIISLIIGILLGISIFF